MTACKLHDCVNQGLIEDTFAWFHTLAQMKHSFASLLRCLRNNHYLFFFLFFFFPGKPIIRAVRYDDGYWSMIGKCYLFHILHHHLLHRVANHTIYGNIFRHLDGLFGLQWGLRCTEMKIDRFRDRHAHMTQLVWLRGCISMDLGASCGLEVDSPPPNYR